MKARIFGAGSIGNHLSHALRNFDYEVEVIDIDEKALYRMQNDIYPTRYGAWDEKIKLYTKPSSDFVDLEIIGTPPDTHGEILIKRLESQKARCWLVEKPFTIPSLRYIVELKEKISFYKDRIFVGYNHSISRSFLELISEINVKNLPTKISCSWLEHWGGIFKAHPWLNGPSDSYLGFKNRGGGALLEHSHGLHLLLILFDKYNLTIKSINKSILMDKENNYDKKTYVFFEFKNHDFPAIYNTDVITNQVSKTLIIESKNETFTLIFGSDNGNSDTYIKKDNFSETKKIFKKNRADDFIQEIKYIDYFLKNNKEIESLKNIHCDYGLKVASVCANIFESNR